MSKLKSHRGAAKRFKKTGGGNYKRQCANLNHILTKKSRKRKRFLRLGGVVHKSNQKAVDCMLGEK